jgi:N-formylglutamate deformylase
VRPQFTTIPGGDSSPCVLHVPHSSTQIPERVRREILLTDRELAGELGAMTDAYTDRIATGAADLVNGPRPWAFVNRLSRLVVDPERFPDETEEMDVVGMGVVYTRTSTGEPLRNDDSAHRSELIRTLFEPYAQALASLVDERLHACGRAVILDIHSYPRDPLPYELHAGGERPEICLGVDPDHTPEWLLAAGADVFTAGRTIRVNTPFSGTYVPLSHYRRELRVASLMIEIRRDVYVQPEGAPDHDAIQRLSFDTATLLERITLAHA